MSAYNPHIVQLLKQMQLTAQSNESVTLSAEDIMDIKAHLITVEVRVTELEDELEEAQDDAKDARRKQEEAEEELETAEYELAELRKNLLPDGVILLEVTSLGHAPDELAAEKIEEWLNRVGLDSAAQLLPLDTQLPAKAGPNQLSISYPQAA